MWLLCSFTTEMMMSPLLSTYVDLLLVTFDFLKFYDDVRDNNMMTRKLRKSVTIDESRIANQIEKENEYILTRMMII